MCSDLSDIESSTMSKLDVKWPNKICMKNKVLVWLVSFYESLLWFLLNPLRMSVFLMSNYSLVP